MRLRVVLLTALLLASALPAESIDGPLSPENAPASFKLAPGLRIELVAAEPLVVSPVAVAFDERGRLWVVENRGYPTGPGEGQPPAGRIAILEDEDSDGRMDRRTEFAGGLTFPNGLLHWDGGLIVTCAPDILYLKDTDGDGQADVRRVLFTGFSTEGSTQLRVSHPTLSLDGWVYVTSGLTGGKVSCPSVPDRPAVELKRTDFRFRPDLSAWEAADGGAQFGQTFDDFNRRFICYNRVQVQHVVLSSEVLRRNPNLAFSETVQNCPAEMQAEPLKGHGAAAKLFPISQNVTTADSHAGTFTAACGLLFYHGMSGLPPEYGHGDCIFSCDPTGNLVHLDHLEPNGATFAARPALEGFEFLASTDNWFRPVFLAQGPYWGLYICDMYRKTIEHPDYLPVEIRKHTDFESGKTMGRIWRVVNNNSPPGSRQRSLDLSAATLCDVLEHGEGWRRSTAHRLLLEKRDDPDATRRLAAMIRDPRSLRVAALHLLDQRGALDDALLKAALTHFQPETRENAMLLAGRRLPDSQAWVEHLRSLPPDPDPRVRFAHALALGGVVSGDAEMAATLARIAILDGRDRWARAAVFSSLAGKEAAFLSSLRTLPRPEAGLPRELMHEFGRLLGASRPQAEWRGLVEQIVLQEPEFLVQDQAAILTGFADALRSRVPDANQEGLLLAALGPETKGGLLEAAIDRLFASAEGIARDDAASSEKRQAAIELLAHASFERAGPHLLRLAESHQPAPVAVAAVRALGRFHHQSVAPTLLEGDRFRAYSPAIRDEVLSAMLAQSHQLPGLLAALEQEHVPASAIDAVGRRMLTEHRDPAVKSRAEKLFGTVAADRAKVYDEFKEVAEWKADPRNGHAVFTKVCAQCHRLDREGYAVGPDLFGIRNQPKASTLLHILVPEHEITQGFTAYTAVTRDGRTLTGLIAAETPTSITLRQPQGKEDTILRSDLDELVASRLSLMPQGLEKNLSKQEFADLLAYLKGEKGP